jgi:predicted transcriptional regulator
MKQQVAGIVAAYVKKNPVSADELPAIIASVSQALGNLGQQRQEAPPEIKPAVPIRRSVTDATITCLDCGWSGMMIKRHLGNAHGLTPEQYRARWGLPQDYPMAARGYSARRSEIAKAAGLGRARTT